MGRSPCCDKQLGLKKGPWTPEEDKILVDYIQAHGHGSWRFLPKLAGLQRCGKSCRLRWINYLRPDIKRGPFTQEEQKSIIQLHGIVGNKWSTIAAQLPGRTDNEVKNYWNTHLKKKLLRMGINPTLTYAPPSTSPLSPSPPNSTTTASSSSTTTSSSFSAARHMAQWETARLEAEARLRLFSSCSASSAATSAATLIPIDNADNAQDVDKEPVDVFLRMWNSDVGKSFRNQNPVILALTNEEESREAEASLSSCNTKQSSALTVSDVDETVKEERVKEEGERDEREEAESRREDETFQFYLDLAGGEDDLGLFQTNHQSCYSFFGSELSEVSLDNDPF